MQTASAVRTPESARKKKGQGADFTAKKTAGSNSRTYSSNEQLKDFPDKQLLELFIAGNEKAFAVLYNRYKSEIYTFCLRMLGGNSAEAGDAFQDTFVKVYERAVTFTYGENVRGWLYMIARNVALNVYRSKRPEETIELHQHLQNNERSMEPDFAGEQRTLRDALEEAIARLPNEFREPFILREFDGLGYPEIADLTGVSLSLVKIRIHRAKSRLRKMLAPLFADEMNAPLQFDSEEEEE
jgi:RNA polymerase sigma-70 factor (ECF subfamily)